MPPPPDMQRRRKRRGMAPIAQYRKIEDLGCVRPLAAYLSAFFLAPPPPSTSLTPYPSGTRTPGHDRSPLPVCRSVWGLLHDDCVEVVTPQDMNAVREGEST